MHTCHFVLEWTVHIVFLTEKIYTKEVLNCTSNRSKYQAKCFTKHL